MGYLFLLLPASLLAAIKGAPRSTRKEAPSVRMVLLFVIVHRFCCLHSRPPQGRGSVRREPLTGSPTRVQSPARRRSLLRSKSAAPKKKDTHVGVFLFCDRPQVLLFVRLAYRKSKKRNEARLATGIPRMAEPFAGALPDLLIQRASRRSRQRVQACPRHSKKKTPS